jgi:hypothetical protein
MTPSMKPLYVLAVATCFAGAPAAMAQSFDGAWKGHMTCAKLSFTKGTQKVAMTVAVAGGRATYTRKVYNRDNSAVVGSEEGSGKVESDGAIALTATWKGTNPKTTYTASYRGAIKGNAASLHGTQVWTHNGKTENRDCAITLKR